MEVEENSVKELQLHYIDRTFTFTPNLRKLLTFKPLNATLGLELDSTPFQAI